MSWIDRASERSLAVQRSRSRSIHQAQHIAGTAWSLFVRSSGSFTIQELAEEAQISLQTVYRYFASKDELLLAVFELACDDAGRDFDAAIVDTDDPLDRLRYLVTQPIDLAHTDAAARPITIEWFRLQALFPDRVAQAARAYTDLVGREIERAAERSLVRTKDAERDAWAITQLVAAAYHQYAFAGIGADEVDGAKEHLWGFCLGGIERRRPRARRAAP